MIDTNVSLFRWPYRRLIGDDPEELVTRLRARGVTQAWAGSFEALLCRDMAGVNLRLARRVVKPVPAFFCRLDVSTPNCRIGGTIFAAATKPIAWRAFGCIRITMATTWPILICPVAFRRGRPQAHCPNRTFDGRHTYPTYCHSAGRSRTTRRSSPAVSAPARRALEPWRMDR